MNIPDKAVEAAVRAAFFEDCGDTSLLAGLTPDERAMWDEQYRNILEAAAPFIAAQALREAAGGIGGQPGSGDYYVGLDSAAEALRDRADELDPQ
jgi:hypothetical protein